MEDLTPSFVVVFQDLTPVPDLFADICYFMIGT